MKKFILLALLLPVLAFGQAEYNQKIIYPFTAGNDTILSAANIYSGDLFVGNWIGAVMLAIQADTMAGGGTVAKDIAVYVKLKDRDLGYGVPYDSLAADSILLGTLDSANVNDEQTFYFDLSNESWWTYTDNIYLILDPGAGADSIRIKARLRGQ